MALQDWLNSDTFAELRDKVNEVIGLLKSGGDGQLLNGNGIGSDPTFENAPPNTLPDQTGNAGKLLGTDGTDPAWVRVDFDRQIDSVSLNASYPPSGSLAQVGNILTTQAGVNRDYKLEWTFDWARISTAPENFWGFYKDGVLLKEFNSVGIPTNSHTQTSTIHFMDKNVAPGVEYTVKIRVSGSTNQVTLKTSVFTIDGTPV